MVSSGTLMTWRRDEGNLVLVPRLKRFPFKDFQSMFCKVGRVINNSKVISTEAEKKKTIIKEENEVGTHITSPIVGTAYLAMEPGTKKFVEVGQKIKKGQTIMIVEAMKTMNHVPSTQDGVVSKILVKDGEPVEFGQPLISIK